MNVLSRPAFSTSALPLRSSPSLLLVLLLFLCAQCTTSRTASAPGCYKARLEVKGMCSNYTIKILEGPVDTGKVAASWTDENTNKSYTNVFALDNACA
ncbi:MAG TPA: hypothetical protein VHK69_10415, partial [Chitinophagaceae bacterium]|nr:hypothetical protein [Chitinophagaceae bacterium]